MNTTHNYGAETTWSGSWGETDLAKQRQSRVKVPVNNHLLLLLSFNTRPPPLSPLPLSSSLLLLPTAIT